MKPPILLVCAVLLLALGLSGCGRTASPANASNPPLAEYSFTDTVFKYGPTEYDLSQFHEAITECTPVGSFINTRIEITVETAHGSYTKKVDLAAPPG